MHESIPLAANGIPWHERRAVAEAALASGDLRIVFIIGMARSGTTWLAQLLAQHGAVSRLRETHLFNSYLGQIPRALRFFKDREGIGVKAATSEDDFLLGVRELAVRTLLGRVPFGAWPRVVVEKTPPHSNHLPFIHRLLPEAYYLVIVRDPRAVAASWHAAGRGWASAWAQQSTFKIARIWNRFTANALAVPTFTDRCLRVRYEDLRAQPVETMVGVFDWLGIPVDRPTCAGFVEACSIEKSRGARHGDGKAPLASTKPGFVRSGSVDGWRKELSKLQVACIENVAHDRMEGLGYHPSEPAWMRPLGTASIAAADVLGRARRGVAIVAQSLSRGVR